MEQPRIVLQQLIDGRVSTRHDKKGRPITERRTVAVVLDEGTGETHVLPWDKKTASPIISIDTLRRLNPGLAQEVRDTLRMAPKHQVKR